MIMIIDFLSMYFRPNLAYNGSVLAKPIKTSLNKRSLIMMRPSVLASKCVVSLSRSPLSKVVFKGNLYLHQNPDPVTRTMKGKDKHFELAGARVIDTRDQLYFQFAYFSALQCVVCKVQCKFTYFIKYRDIIMHCCEKNVIFSVLPSSSQRGIRVIRVRVNRVKWGEMQGNRTQLEQRGVRLMQFCQKICSIF